MRCERSFYLLLEGGKKGGKEDMLGLTRLAELFPVARILIILISYEEIVLL